ncbi:MAG: lamin tail domain-containing protein [bacterium]
MKPNTLRRAIAVFAILTAFALISCGTDSAVNVPPPVLTTIAVTIPAASLVPGQTTTATAAGKDQNSVDIASGTVSWSSSSTATATVSASGVITAVAPGTAQIIATVGTITGQQSVTVTVSPAIEINEVESNGGTPGDWIELYNATSVAVDISGWGIRDNDTTHVIYKIPAGTTIAAGGYYVVEEAQFGFGLGAADEARLYNQFGSIVEVSAWTAHAATTYGRCPNANGAFSTSTSSTKGAPNDCSIAVKINEVESSGGTPGDWVELYNFGPIPVDISGFVVKDDDDTHVFTIPGSTTIAAGAYYVVEEASLGFGLGQPDAARLFNSTGTLVDSYAWTTHAGVTYGRCPDATGAFVNTAASTKGAANSCGAVASTPWPGADDVTTVDGTSVFGGNLSGLIYEGTGASAVLWGARNGPGSIFRLLFNGTTWAPDAANSWNAGKTLHYPDGTGEPDTEDITYTTGSAAGLYIVAERNNSANSVSRNSILRFDPSGAATTLTATNEWNLTADLPATGANLGVEGITWIPDVVLVSKGFYDEAANRVYNPADYPNHGGGLFFVGVEANGIIYAYALDHTTNTFTRVATFATGFPTGVMALQYDRDLNYLFAACDDGCGGLLATFEINTTAGSATLGRFRLTRQFNRPPSMPNINNEGFAVAPTSECIAGKRFVYWSDDSETGGHAIRRATFPCAALP